MKNFVYSKPVQYTLSFLTVTGGSLTLWVLFGCPQTGIDDANIFFVYANHFSQGKGFVYNVGGEVVEGFTSLLWTLVCSVGWRFFQPLEIFLFLLNILLGAITLSACLRHTKHPIYFLILVAAAPAWFVWCQVTLMESGLWCLLVTMSILATVERRGKVLAAWFPLMIATRPEAMLWGGWLLMVFCFSSGIRLRIRSVLIPATSFFASVIGITVFRLWYFGHPLPNTYYAKVSPDYFSNVINGSKYFGAYILSNPAVLYAVMVSFWFLFSKDGKRNNTNRIVLCLLPGLGIPVLVGGYHFGSFRFFQPVWPLLCLVTSSGVFISKNSAQVIKEKYIPLGMRALIIPSILFLVGWLTYPLTANVKHEFVIAKQGRENGEKLKQMFRDLHDLPTVAVITAGGIKLSYPGKVFDLMGLNWPEMAHAPRESGGLKNHSAFNRTVFYYYQPDILLCVDNIAFEQKVLKGLQNEAEFKHLYEKRIFQRNGVSFSAYYRKEYLTELPQSGINTSIATRDEPTYVVLCGNRLHRVSNCFD